MTLRLALIIALLSIHAPALASLEAQEKDTNSLRADELAQPAAAAAVRKSTKMPPLAPDAGSSKKPPAPTAEMPQAAPDLRATSSTKPLPRTGITPPIPPARTTSSSGVIPFAPADADDPLPSPYAEHPPVAAPRIDSSTPNFDAPSNRLLPASGTGGGTGVPVPSLLVPANSPSGLLAPGTNVPTIPGELAPPSLPARPPIPPPPAVTLLPPRAQIERAPLAWRSRAYELVSSLHGGKYAGVRVTHDYAATADETLTALAQACNQLSMQVDSYSVPAHQIALRNSAQDTITIVVAADQSSDSITTLIGGLLPDSKAFGSAAIIQLFEKTASILNNKGML